MSRTVGVAGVAFIALGILAWNSLFVVEQQEQAIIRQLGAPKRVIQDPGLKMKIPFIQDVVIYDKRILDMDPPAEPVTLTDQKRLVVDTYTRYRIADPLKFLQTVGNEFNANSQLSQIVSAALRRVLGNVTMSSLLSSERLQIMADIQKESSENALQYGIRVVDVRIRRADLPDETSQAIYDRMKSEREREARENRAQGSERAQQIRARAERERTVILAESQKMAQIAKGQGDAEANRIYADAYGKDPKFFAFYRAMQSYKQAIGDKDTTLILSPESDFFKYLEGPNVGK